tara:strand:+ start:96 stop:461 length:366 start_codon:yes stop_codon:yes gene_type:complete
MSSAVFICSLVFVKRGVGENILTLTHPGYTLSLFNVAECTVEELPVALRVMDRVSFTVVPPLIPIPGGEKHSPGLTVLEPSLDDGVIVPAVAPDIGDPTFTVIVTCDDNLERVIRFVRSSE